MRGHQMKARSLPSSSCPSSEAAESVHTRTIKRAGTTFTARMPSATTANGCEAAHVVRDFMDALDENEDLAVAVAAIRALTAVIERSSASTRSSSTIGSGGASAFSRGAFRESPSVAPSAEPFRSRERERRRRPCGASVSAELESPPGPSSRSISETDSNCRGRRGAPPSRLASGSRPSRAGPSGATPSLEPPRPPRRDRRRRRLRPRPSSPSLGPLGPLGPLGRCSARS